MWRARDSLRQLDFGLGGFALAAILLHDLAHVREGRWYDVFWVCNLAALLVGPAVLSRSALLSTVALTWLLPGTIVWLLDALLAGARILPTSYGVHLGGSAVAAYGVWRWGPAKKSFAAALTLPALGALISRVILPPVNNVNAVHAIPRGWSFLGHDFWPFMLSVVTLVVVVSGLGQLCAWLLTRLPRSSGS